jgi:hypothetical protein
MKMKKVALLLSCCIFMAGSVLAQVHFFCAQDTIPTNQSNYAASVRVSDFNEIVGAQFTFTWDSSVLSYSGVRDLAPFLGVIEHFGEDNTAAGVLRFAWYNDALTGISLPDSAQLFTVDFDVIGSGGGRSDLAFSNVPTIREVVDTSFVGVPANFTDGLVFLNPASQLSTLASELRVERIQPNPVRQADPLLYFYINKTDTLLVRIVRIDGKQIYQQTIPTAYPGEQSLRLSRSIFGQAGVYVVILQTDQFIATQKLIVSE